MIRAVFDANVIVASFPAELGTLATLLDRWLTREFRLVLSDYILDEIARAWAKPYWRNRVTPAEIDAAFRLLRRRAEITPISVSVVGIAAHAEDDMVIATALSAEVDYLVSGDKELQALGAYQGVRIVSPAAFLAILDDAS